MSSCNSEVQYSTVQYSTVQYSTVQYSTVQYSTEAQQGMAQHADSLKKNAMTYTYANTIYAQAGQSATQHIIKAVLS